MHLNTVDIAVLAAYFVSMLGLGLYQARTVKSTGDFFAGGRKFSRAVNVIGFAVALAISLLFVLLLWGVGRIGA